MRRSRRVSQNATDSLSAERSSCSQDGSSRKDIIVRALAIVLLCGGVVVAGSTSLLDLSWLQSPVAPAHILAVSWAVVVGWAALDGGRWGVAAMAWSGSWVVSAIVATVTPESADGSRPLASVLTPVGLWVVLLGSLAWVTRSRVRTRGTGKPADE